MEAHHIVEVQTEYFDIIWITFILQSLGLSNLNYTDLIYFAVFTQTGENCTWKVGRTGVLLVYRPPLAPQPPQPPAPPPRMC